MSINKQELSNKFLKKAYEMNQQGSVASKYVVGFEMGISPNEVMEIVTILKNKDLLILLSEQRPEEQVSARSDFEITDKGKKLVIESMN